MTPLYGQSMSHKVNIICIGTATEVKYLGMPVMNLKTMRLRNDKLIKYTSLTLSFLPCYCVFTWVKLINKTEYFRLCLSYEVRYQSLKKAETDMREKDSVLLDKLVPNRQTYTNTLKHLELLTKPITMILYLGNLSNV